MYNYLFPSAGQVCDQDCLGVSLLKSRNVWREDGVCDADSQPATVCSSTTFWKRAESGQLEANCLSRAGPDAGVAAASVP